MKYSKAKQLQVRKVKKVIRRDLITPDSYEGKFTKYGKPKLLPHNKLLKKAQAVFNAWIRRRDAKQGCYAKELNTCKGSFCACHLFGVGKSAVRFDEVNVNGGCAYHNQIHDHTMRPQPQIYTAWFIKEYGSDMYLDLVDRSKMTKKWTREELINIIKKYSL